MRDIGGPPSQKWCGRRDSRNGFRRPNEYPWSRNRALICGLRGIVTTGVGTVSQVDHRSVNDATGVDRSSKE